MFNTSLIYNWSCLLTRTLELASSNLDRRVHCVNLRPSSRSTSRTCKEQSGAAAADRTPTPKSVTEPPNTSRVTLRNSQGTVQCSLSHYAQELASLKKTIWTCVPQKFVGKPLYTWSLSLSWQLRIWTRGSHPTVHVPSSGASLTWALLLTLLWLSYLCMILLSA